MRIHVRHLMLSICWLVVIAYGAWRSFSVQHVSQGGSDNITRRYRSNYSQSKNKASTDISKSPSKISNQEKVIRPLKKDFCSPSPCQNGATCRSYWNRPVCYCKPGFIGRECEEEIDEKHQQREALWLETIKKSKTKERRRRFPDVIGIGVEKCGTDALISFLKQHPAVQTPMGQDETQFFNAKYDKSISHYLLSFPKVADDEILIEKTPAYFNFLPVDVPFRIKKWIPNAKIILVLCDPVNRTYSDYVHEKIMGGIWDGNTFDNLIHTYLRKYNGTLTENLKKPDSKAFEYITKIHKKDKPSHILTTGLYYYHLLRWIEAFDTRNLYIVDGENLVEDPGAEIEKLEEYLGLPKLLLKDDFERNNDTGFFCFAPKWSQNIKILGEMDHRTSCLSKSKGRTRNKPREASDEVITSLKEFYRPFDEKLFKLLGKKMSWG